jgi:acyl-coenzyme A synthetase/AMP-(fatty) acid ligase
VVLETGAELGVVDLQDDMQTEITKHLTSLFRMQDVVITDAMPRTASHKMMRWVLRDRYRVEET